MYNCAVIGFGGLGKLHLTNLMKLTGERGDFRIGSICGADKASFTKSVKLNLGEVDMSSMDLSQCNLYDDYKELIEREKPDFIVSALPTYLHEEAAVYALRRGAHVFSEKPMALSAKQCKNMINAARESGKRLMIGQCLRFDPAYAKLKEYIDCRTFGKAYRAEFTRYSQMPVWSWNNWLLDPALSGGCVLDMHVHDVDLINWYFGKPASLRSAVTGQKAELESVFTEYFYDGLLVTSSADWSLPQTFPFEARCLVNFEEAAAIVEDGRLTIYKDNESFSPELSDEHYFMAEMRAFLKLAIDGEECTITSPESVFDSVQLALAEIESGKKGTAICF